MIKKNKIIGFTEWKYGRKDKIFLYIIIGILFSSSLILDMKNRWDKKTDKITLIVTILNYFGFLLLLIFQIRQKWISGLIIVSITNIVALFVVYKTVKNLYIT